MGAEGKYDLALAASHDPDKLQKHLAAVKGATVPVVGATAKPKGLSAADAVKSKVTTINGRFALNTRGFVTLSFGILCKCGFFCAVVVSHA